MGFFKTQRGRINGMVEEPDKEKEIPQNGQSKDLECEHGLRVNACKQCIEALKQNDDSE